MSQMPGTEVVNEFGKAILELLETHEKGWRRASWRTPLEETTVQLELQARCRHGGGGLRETILDGVFLAVNKDTACLYIFSSRCIRHGHATIGRLATRVPSSSGHGTIAGNALRREQSPDGVFVAESVGGAFALAKVVTGVGQGDGAQCFVARRDSRRGCFEDGVRDSGRHGADTCGDVRMSERNGSAT